MFKGYTPPAGRPISQEDIENSDTDTAIYVLSRQAGEGGDRKAEKGDLFITDEERAAIETCVANIGQFL